MFSLSTKIMNPNGKKLDKFESGIFQALLKLQMNSNIKEQLLSTKIMNPNGKKLDKFESGIFQALLKLQMNSNIKEQL
ncbi:40S ribosomal protein S7 [Cricetulus griseus]|uniref:40S ribosomal protein S7 n=1 Tax=Cricetulus griseus TaxID=10029 RepID=G3HNX7_CRIGR|nr:40S ribosomal protein S7 [Cricetulus griseus]